jgi:hypothetical protein
MKDKTPIEPGILVLYRRTPASGWKIERMPNGLTCGHLADLPRRLAEGQMTPVAAQAWKVNQGQLYAGVGPQRLRLPAEPEEVGRADACQRCKFQLACLNGNYYNSIGPDSFF